MKILNYSFKALLFIVFLFNVKFGNSQATYIVYLKSKKLNIENLRLSKETIERRQRYSIPIDDLDYSIESNRIDKLNNISPILLKSKWLNAISLKATDNQILKIKSLDFVQRVEVLRPKYQRKSRFNKFDVQYTKEEYGNSYNQIKVHNGEILHDKGFTGAGMKIAVFDAGFRNVPNISSFKHLFNDNRIHAVRNIVENSADVYRLDGHGTGVLGTMAGFLKDSFIGSAPQADYFLFLTEDPRSETRQEEFNWVVAAEMADSMGMDIINSSLGYHYFDDPVQNYSKEDMNGNTTIISKGAKIAAEKGILVVNSAGNHGNNDWHIITAPADVEGVVSVGATDVSKNLADFSSRGYNAKNIIKPNIMSVGKNTTLYYDNGNYSHGSGTSFSAPLIAGLIACYWQSNRNLNSEELKEIIYKYSSNYHSPNKEFGFGFPLFDKIINIQSPITNTEQISIYPNPSTRFTIVEVQSDNEIEDAEMNVYFGRKGIMKSKVQIKKGVSSIFIDTKGYAKGLYFLKIKMKNGFLEERFIVQ